MLLRVMDLDASSENGFYEAAKFIPGRIGAALGAVGSAAARGVYEICLRAGRPLILTGAGEPVFVRESGSTALIRPPDPLCAEVRELNDCFAAMCGYSVHSHSREISEGFLTLDGGHRAGFCGTAVMRDGSVDAVRDISSVSIRIARENRDAARELSERLFAKRAGGVIVCGAPSSGKTTVLRDLTRRLSDGLCGRCYKVSLADERNEIAAVRGALPRFDVGANTDILTLYPKRVAVDIALRSLSPEIIVCDEVGTLEETSAITRGFNSGVKFAVSVHADGRRDFLLRPHCEALVMSGAFENAVFLRRGGGKISYEIVTTEELRDEIGGVRSDILGVYRSGTYAGRQTVTQA